MAIEPVFVFVRTISRTGTTIRAFAFDTPFWNKMIRKMLVTHTPAVSARCFVAGLVLRRNTDAVPATPAAKSTPANIENKSVSKSAIAIF